MHKLFRVFVSALILPTLLVGIAPVSIVHAATTLTVTNSLNSGAGSLRQAMLDASDGDTIVFSANFTITLLSQLPVVDGKAITVNGKGMANTIIQASICDPVTLPGNCTPASYRIFEISPTGGLTLDGLTVRHGNCDGACATNLYAGGGIYNQGSLSISNSSFTGNSAISGGGIYSNGIDLTLMNVTFSGDHAANGGGLYNFGGNPTITNSTFSGNIATSNGGGLYNVNDSPVLTGVTFSGNSASANGGGMYNDNSSPTVMSVILLGNSANSGGGIYNANNSNPIVTTSIFSNNTAVSQGGGMRNSSSNPIISDSTFSGNAAHDGGGVSNLNSNPIISDSTFSGNSTTANGGGMYNYISAATISNSIFSSNSATADGGGIYNESSSPTITDSTFLSNSAAARGGGIFNYFGTLTITNSTFSKNSTAHAGGGLFNQYVSSPIITNVTFSDNTADTNGGGMFNDTSSPTVFNSTFSGNNADLAGGGMYNQNSSNPILKNVILWGDTTNGSGPELYNGSTPIISYSIVQGSGGSASWDASFGTDGGNNLDSDPLLGSLANNGGPTQTMALLAGSPAIDNGTNINCPSTDQRGMARPFGSHCDIGAFEYVNQAPTDIDLSNNNVDENQPVGTTVGTLSTADPDAGDTFTYAFCGGPDDASFSITGNTLKTTAVFDYETRTDYSVCIKSTDNGSSSITKNFVISVNNLIDTQTFADVDMSYWAWQFIERLYNAGITGGCSENPLNYCPEDSVTRAQMAVFLERGVHYPASFVAPDVAPTFSDTVGHWAEDWIESLKNDGITAGCTLDLYCPDFPVTRAQMAVFLLKSRHGANYTPPNATGVFTDVPVGYWADDWIEQLAAENITSGCGNGNYCPEDPVTRAQMAIFLVKTFNLP